LSFRQWAWHFRPTHKSIPGVSHAYASALTSQTLSWTKLKWIWFLETVISHICCSSQPTYVYMHPRHANDTSSSEQKWTTPLSYR
jgi:hypothetical protein